MASPFHYTSIEEFKTLALDNNFFNKDYIKSSQNQEISSSKSSSPTALGLLLRSSVFRELVEKNLNMFGDEADEEDTKDQQAHISCDDELSSIFYDSIDDIPFVNDPKSYNFVRELHSIL